MKTIIAIGSICFLLFVGNALTAPIAKHLIDSTPEEAVIVNLDEWFSTHPIKEGSFRTDKIDYSTIAEITKERVRRVITNLKNSESSQLPMEEIQQKDLGFRVFKLGESNCKSWNAEIAHDEKILQEKLFEHVNHIREGRNTEEILYEILIKSGFELTTNVECLSLASKKVYSVGGGVLFICLEREFSLELIREIAEKKPERIVCLDEGFAGKDQLKANAVQIFRTKGITSFKTV